MLLYLYVEWPKMPEIRDGIMFRWACDHQSGRNWSWSCSLGDRILAIWAEFRWSFLEWEASRNIWTSRHCLARHISADVKFILVHCNLFRLSLRRKSSEVFRALLCITCSLNFCLLHYDWLRNSIYQLL